MATRSLVGLATAVRMVDRVHGDTTALRALALVPVASRLADLDVLVVCVRKGSDGRAALGPDHAHLGRRQTQRDHVAFFRGELDRSSGGTPELASLAGAKLDVVDERADRHVLQLQAVAG